MNFNKLVRDAAKVQSALKETSDGRLIALREVKLYIPSRWEGHRGLARIGVETYVTGICGLVVDDLYYVASVVCAMFRIEPTATLRTMIDGDEYFEFVFAPGSTVLASLDLLKSDTLTYYIFNEIMTKGRVPAYLSLDDLGGLFETAQLHAGAKIGGNQEVTELIASIIARDPEDRSKYYRQTIQDLSSLRNRPPAYVPLRSVQYAASNTTNKLAGSYYKDALTSALVNPATRVERVESLLLARTSPKPLETFQKDS